MTSVSAIGRRALPALVLAGGVLAGALGLGAGVASAQPPADPNVGEPVPSWAPRKTAEMWDGHPVVWTSAWGGRWGVWINGMFITLSSNPVTNGG